MNQLFITKKRPPTRQKEMEEQQNDSDEEQKDDTEKEKETEDFISDKIDNHQIKISRKHNYAKHGEPLYRVRLFVFKRKDDTWESTSNLPGSNMLSYVKTKKLETPYRIDKAVEG